MIVLFRIIRSIRTNRQGVVHIVVVEIARVDIARVIIVVAGRAEPKPLKPNAIYQCVTKAMTEIYRPT